MLKGLVCAIISAIGFGTLPILGKLGYGLGMETFELLSYRFGLGALMLAGVLAVKNPRALLIRPRTLAKAVAVGMCLSPLQSTCFMSAVKYIPAATTTLILYFYPITVTLLSMLFFRMRVGRWVALSLVLVTAGCALVFYDAFAQSMDPTGLAFATGAMAIFSVYLIISQQILKNEPPLPVALYVVLSAAVVFTALAGPPDLSAMTWEKAAVAAALGLFPTAVAVGLLYTAIESIGSAYTSIFSTLEPVATVALAWLVLDEPLAPVQLAGAACIIVGICLPNMRLLRRRAAVAPAD